MPPVVNRILPVAFSRRHLYRKHKNRQLYCRSDAEERVETVTCYRMDRFACSRNAPLERGEKKWTPPPFCVQTRSSFFILLLNAKFFLHGSHYEYYIKYFISFIFSKRDGSNSSIITICRHLFGDCPPVSDSKEQHDTKQAFTWTLLQFSSLG